MRIVATLLLALLASSAPALSQQKPPGSITAEDETGTVDAESCVEVDIGGAKALDCINRKLKKETDRVKPIPNLPPVDARSQDIHLGIVNSPAVQQQYGPNFGKSVIPYRPPATYAPPSLGGH